MWPSIFVKPSEKLLPNSWGELQSTGGPLASALALAKLTASVTSSWNKHVTANISCGSHLVCDGTGSKSHLCWHVGVFLNPIGCGNTWQVRQGDSRILVVRYLNIKDPPDGHQSKYYFIYKDKCCVASKKNKNCISERSWGFILAYLTKRESSSGAAFCSLLSVNKTSGWSADSWNMEAVTDVKVMLSRSATRQALSPPSGFDFGMEASGVGLIVSGPQQETGKIRIYQTRFWIGIKHD